MIFAPAACAGLFALFFVTALANGAPDPAANAPGPATRPAPYIQFKNADGHVVAALRQEPAGGTLRDASDNLLARYERQTHEGKSEYRIESREQLAIGYVTGGEGRWEIRDDKRDWIFYALIGHKDDWRVEDHYGRLVYAVTPHSDGPHLEGPSGNFLYRISTKEGRTALRNVFDIPSIQASASIDPLICAMFGMPRLSPVQQGALAVALGAK